MKTASQAKINYRKFILKVFDKEYICSVDLNDEKPPNISSLFIFIFPGTSSFLRGSAPNTETLCT